MTNFLQVKTVHETMVLIKIEQIITIEQGIDLNYNFIWLKNGQNIKTTETIQEIAAKL
jgi:hypothetical protein